MAGFRPGTEPFPQASPPAPRSGAEGNERLTAMTGAVLLILLAVECYTILRIGRLPRLLAAEARGAAARAMEVLSGRGTRLALLISSLLAGLVIALLTVHLAGKWEPFG